MKLTKLAIKKLVLCLPYVGVMSLISGSHLSAQNIQVIPASPYDQTPSNEDSFNLSPDFIPPLPQQVPTRDTIVIQGTSRPAPAPPVSGDIVNSPQILPSPPTLNQPYGSSPSVSPYNQTPVNTSPYNQTPVNNAPANNTRVIIEKSAPPTPVLPHNQLPASVNASPYNYTPQDNPTVISPPRNINTKPRPISEEKRRNLGEILVFDTITVAPEVIEEHRLRRQNSQGSFRVLVSVQNSGEESRLKSLYPNAFRATHQGQTVWQIGVFSSSQNANKASQPLKGAGFTPIITP